MNQAVAEADERSRRIIAEAETEAARIVAAATHEAYRLSQQAHEPAGLPSEVIQQLQRTVDEFAHVNNELLSELSLLMQTLGEYRRPKAAPVDSDSRTLPAPDPAQAEAPVPEPPVGAQASAAPTLVEAPPPPPPPPPPPWSAAPPPPPPPPWSAAPPPPPPPGGRYWDGIPARHLDDGDLETPPVGPGHDDTVIAS